MAHVPDGPPPPQAANSGTIRLLTLLLALSLALHAATIYTLFQARSAARTQALALAEELGQARESVISLSVPVRQQIPISATIPVRKTLTVPIRTSIAIDTEFTVPLRTPFGTYDIPVPIRGEVPVALEAPVTLDDTVTVSTTVNLDTSLPLELPVGDTPLAAYLDRLRAALLQLSEQL